MMKRIWGIAFAIMLVAVKPAEAGFSDYWETLKHDVATTYHEGRPSLMVPFYAWHNRWAYDEEKWKKYNEEAWGLGYSHSYYDGLDWHGLYGMVFEDSNHHAETMFGYGYLKNFALTEDFLVGIGYTLGLTQRSEYAYIPIPLPLPIAGITYKKLSINAAYVPGVKNDGNVLFLWTRYDF